MRVFDENSVLAGLESSVPAVRNLMTYLFQQLIHTDITTHDSVGKDGTRVLDNILQACEGSRLFHAMTARFSSAHDCIDELVANATQEYDSLAIPAVIKPSSHTKREFDMAELAFKQQHKDGPNYAAKCSKLKSIEGDNRGEHGPLVDLESTANSGQDDGQMSRSELDESDKDGQTDSESENEELTSEQEAELSKILRRKVHAPVRARGERFVEDDEQDRTPAVVGKPDITKLRATFKTVRDDESNPGATIPGKPATYVYPRFVDWDNKKSVSKLNSWRTQMFCRALGSKRESRNKWMLSEHDYLIKILMKHLKNKATAGCFSRINWKWVMAKFNKHFQGKVFQIGEHFAPQRETGKKGKKIGAAAAEDEKVLTKTQKWTPRTATGLASQLVQFNSDAARNLVKKAKDEGEEKRLVEPVSPSAAEAVASSTSVPYPVLASKSRKRAQDGESESKDPTSTVVKGKKTSVSESTSASAQSEVKFSGKSNKKRRV